MREDPRPIVICCDGTYNTFGRANTNVRRIFDLLDDKRYRRYYDPGIGTKPERGLFKHVTRWRNRASRLVGMGTKCDVLDAYEFLMNQFIGDASKVFLFGFSRGALTVRRLAKMVATCGLPPQGCSNLISHAYDAYLCFKKDPEAPVYISFKELSRKCHPDFIGVWDTVRATPSRENPKPEKNECEMTKQIKCGRHALSLDEKRHPFAPELWKDEGTERIKQRWFPGDHSDVGGGHHKEELSKSDLSYISLDWILREANKAGLGLEDNKGFKEIHKQAEIVRKEAQLNLADMLHDESMKLKWWLSRGPSRAESRGIKHDTVEEAIRYRVDLLDDEK